MLHWSHKLTLLGKKPGQKPLFFSVSWQSNIMPLPLNITIWVSLIRMSSAIPLSGSSTLTIWITERDDLGLWSVNLCVVWPLCKWYIPNVGRYLLYCEQLLYCAAREQARHCVTAIIIHCHWQGYIFCRKRAWFCEGYFWGASEKTFWFLV